EPAGTSMGRETEMPAPLTRIRPLISSGLEIVTDIWVGWSGGLYPPRPTSTERSGPDGAWLVWAATAGWPGLVDRASVDWVCEAKAGTTTSAATRKILTTGMRRPERLAGSLAVV